MQIKNSAKEYDVIIVGSGAGGGMATKILSEAGLSVAVVEAGPYYDPANPEQMTQLKWAWHSPRRGAGTRRFFGDYDQAYGGWEIDGEPYGQVGDTDFKWFRSRMLGGRTNHWGRIPYVLDLMILKEKVLMVLVKIGQFLMMILNLIMTRLIN